MRTRTPLIVGFIVLAAFVGGIAVGAQVQIRQQAPADRAADFPLAELEAIVQEMDAEQRQTVRLLEGGSYNVNMRRIRGGETALMHPRTTDVYVIREGSGTLVTGGEIVDESGAPVDGQRGAAIRGGEERVIGAGDLIFIPAGVPHGIRETDGITWFNIRFDTLP
jgi:mannose-6-phosphate isomerase-like protein (cupin superfamily)